MVESKLFLIQKFDLLSKLRGIMERTGFKLITFSNLAAVVRALPACHKWPTKNPRTKNGR